VVVVGWEDCGVLGEGAFGECEVVDQKWMQCAIGL